MTNEEIEQRVCEVVRTHYDDEYLSTRNRLEIAIIQLVRTCISQAYEEAAKATCRLCRLQVPLTVSKRSDGIYLRHVKSEHAGEVRCSAAAIRELKVACF